MALTSHARDVHYIRGYQRREVRTINMHLFIRKGTRNIHSQASYLLVNRSYRSPVLLLSMGTRPTSTLAVLECRDISLTGIQGHHRILGLLHQRHMGAQI